MLLFSSTNNFFNYLDKCLQLQLKIYCVKMEFLLILNCLTNINHLKNEPFRKGINFNLRA